MIAQTRLHSQPNGIIPRLGPRIRIASVRTSVLFRRENLVGIERDVDWTYASCAAAMTCYQMASHEPQRLRTTVQASFERVAVPSGRE
jgi:hypothetical protein